MCVRGRRLSLILPLWWRSDLKKKKKKRKKEKKKKKEKEKEKIFKVQHYCFYGTSNIICDSNHCQLSLIVGYLSLQKKNKMLTKISLLPVKPANSKI